MRALLNGKNGEKVKVFVRLCLTLAMVFGMAMTCYASSYSENAVNWGLGELSWIILMVAIAGAAMSITRRATGAAIGCILAGAVLWYICQNPTLIGEIGTRIGDTIFK